MVSARHDRDRGKPAH